MYFSELNWSLMVTKTSTFKLFKYPTCHISGKSQKEQRREKEGKVELTEVTWQTCNVLIDITQYELC